MRRRSPGTSAAALAESPGNNPEEASAEPAERGKDQDDEAPRAEKAEGAVAPNRQGVGDQDPPPPPPPPEPRRGGRGSGGLRTPSESGTRGERGEGRRAEAPAGGVGDGEFQAMATAARARAVSASRPVSLFSCSEEWGGERQNVRRRGVQGRGWGRKSVSPLPIFPSRAPKEGARGQEWQFADTERC